MKDWTISFPVCYKTGGQEVSKEINALNNKYDFVDMSRSSLNKCKIPIYFSSTFGSFAKTDDNLGQKRYFNKILRFERAQNIFLDNNGVKLQISNKKTPGDVYLEINYIL